MKQELKRGGRSIMCDCTMLELCDECKEKAWEYEDTGEWEEDNDTYSRSK